MKKILALIGIPLLLFGCSEKGLQNLNDVLSNTKDVLGESEPRKLTNTEVISGLKEALKVGADSAVAFVSKMNGFYKNPSIFIEFPPQAIKVKNTLNDAGLGSLMDDFEMIPACKEEGGLLKAQSLFGKDLPVIVQELNGYLIA